MTNPKKPAWRHFDLVMKLLAFYVALAPLLWVVAVGGGALSDIGHPGGEARGISFMMSTLRSVSYVYLAFSFLLLILIRFRNPPCLVVNGLVFALALYCSVRGYHPGF